MKRLTYAFIKKRIEEEGYKLISKSYKNIRVKLSIRCKEGHIYLANWDSFRTGYRCPIYALMVLGEKKRHSYRYVKEQIEKEGYKLISKEYRGTHFKLEVRCPLGHIFKARFYTFQRGNKCPYCAGRVRLTYEYVKGQIEKEGYKLISKGYKNSCSKLEIECNKGHIYKVKWGNFNQGQRCPICMLTGRSGKNSYNWKGGMSPVYHYLRNHRLYRDWQRKQVKRFKNRCVINDAYSKNIVMHHLTNFSDLLKEFRCDYSTLMKDIIRLEEFTLEFFKRHDSLDGVPLLRDTHVEFHNTYGNKNNIVAQFEEFYLRRTGKIFIEKFSSEA